MSRVYLCETYRRIFLSTLYRNNKAIQKCGYIINLYTGADIMTQTEYYLYGNLCGEKMNVGSRYI
jgi:hypothetical protein